MKIYAIDPSIKGCAHTVLEDGNQIYTGRIDTSDMEGFDRVITITKKVAEVLEQYKPDVVVMENYAFTARTNCITKLAELGGCLKMIIFQAGYQTGRDAILRGEKTFFTQAIGKMKKFCLANGSAKKDSRYLLGVFERIKRKFDNDDEADAYMHAYMASIVVGVIKGQVEISNLTAYQQEALIEMASKSRKGLSITKALKLPEAEKQKLVRSLELTA